MRRERSHPEHARDVARGGGDGRIADDDAGGGWHDAAHGAAEGNDGGDEGVDDARVAVRRDEKLRERVRGGVAHDLEVGPRGGGRVHLRGGDGAG